MIQRPQSLLLLASSIIMLITLFIPLWDHTINEFVTAELTSFSITVSTGIEKIEILKQESVVYIGGIAILSSIISLGSLFMYNNRMLQMKLGIINSLVICAHVGIVAMVALPKAQELLGTTDAGHHDIGFYLPLVAVLMNMISNRMIKKDEDLVRSVDRIR